MRVLIINETPVPTDERAWLEARSLAGAGHDVTVVCPWRDSSDPRERTLAGVRIRTYPPPAAAAGVLGYVWEFAYCWLRSLAGALWAVRHGGFDVIHACSPPDTFWLLGALFKPFGVKYVFAQHDLSPELWQSRFAEGEGGLKSRTLLQGLLFLERMSYLVADRVIVPNESYKWVARRRGKLPADRIVVVRNGPDLDKVKMVDSDPALRCGRNHLVCYLGIMNPQDGIDYLLRSAQVLVHEMGRTDTHFALVGTGDSMAELEAMARDLGVADHITFTGWISDPDLLSAYLSTADVCVAPDPKTPLNEVSSFMKIMDYMAVAKPIVAFDLAETRVSAADAALYAVPDDVTDFACCIAELLDDEPRRLAMGRIGRARIESSLAWDHCAAHLLKLYGQLGAAPVAGTEVGDATVSS